MYLQLAESPDLPVRSVDLSKVYVNTPWGKVREDMFDGLTDNDWEVVMEHLQGFNVQPLAGWWKDWMAEIRRRRRHREKLREMRLKGNIDRRQTRVAGYAAVRHGKADAIRSGKWERTDVAGIVNSIATNASDVAQSIWGKGSPPPRTGAPVPPMNPNNVPRRQLIKGVSNNVLYIGGGLLLVGGAYYLSQK